MPTPSIEACIMQLLRDNTTLNDIVDGRIHVGHRPQGETLASIVVRLEEYGDMPALDADETDIQPRIAVDCYSGSYFHAHDLDQLVRGTDDDPCLCQWTGEVTVHPPGVAEYGSRVIDAIVPEDTTADAGDPQDGSDQRTYRRSTLFFVIAHK